MISCAFHPIATRSGAAPVVQRGPDATRGTVPRLRFQKSGCPHTFDKIKHLACDVESQLVCFTVLRVPRLHAMPPLCRPQGKNWKRIGLSRYRSLWKVWVIFPHRDNRMGMADCFARSSRV